MTLRTNSGTDYEMKYATLLLVFVLNLHSTVYGQSFTATVKEMGKPKGDIVFTIDLTRTVDRDKKNVVSLTKEKENVMLEEKAVLDAKTNEILQYDINSSQTGEVGHLVFTSDKIEIEYIAKGKAPVKKTIKKPQNLAAPANFEEFFQMNFEKLKKDRTMVVNFLVWDRQDTYEFKISYMGEVKLGNEVTQSFKMNINSIIISTFVSPIRVWFSQDMKQIRQFSGRIGVKRKEASGKLSDFDGDVVYTYK